MSLLAIALPFFLIASLVPNVLARWGVGVEVLATVLLIGITGMVARSTIRPVVALSRAAVRVESGDRSVRVAPGGSGEMRLLGQTFNAMLERLAAMVFRLRGAVAEVAAQLAAAAGQLARHPTAAIHCRSGDARYREHRSRLVAATVQQVAVAASRQDELAADLAWSMDDRGWQGEMRKTDRGA